MGSGNERRVMEVRLWKEWQWRWDFGKNSNGGGFGICGNERSMEGMKVKNISNATWKI